MSAAPPPCRLVLSQRSIIDTLFINQTPRRPAYATTTDGSMTTLWCINHRGKLLQVAQIHWQGDRASSSSSTLVVNGQVMLVDNVLKRTKKFFGSDSRTFTAGTIRCKWKSSKTGVQVLADSGQASVRASINSSSEIWTCYDTTTSTIRSPNTASSASAALSPIVAVFFPPQLGLIKSELTIYPSGGAIVDHIILTAILICAQKDEWRSVQSNTSKETLEASLVAEMRGALPPYVPTAAARYRVTSPPMLRRPHSASAARTRYASPPAPPPYTSVDDISIPHR